MRPSYILMICLALFVATTCSAAVITFLGENSTNAASWRISSVSKTINPANNNIYGNDGYVMFNTTPTNSTVTQSNSPVNPFTFSTTVGSTTLKTLNVTPSYVSAFTPGASFNSVFTSPSSLNMDNPAGGSMKSGVAFESGSTSTFTSLFSFTVNSSVPKSFTVGLFFNNGAGEWAQARITDSAGGSATATRAGFGNIDAMFFTISGATSGTVFTISGLASTRGEANGALDIAGITFDSTPEPTTLGGCAGAALAFIWFDRRRRKPSR